MYVKVLLQKVVFGQLLSILWSHNYQSFRNPRFELMCENIFCSFWSQPARSKYILKNLSNFLLIWSSIIGFSLLVAKFHVVTFCGVGVLQPFSGLTPKLFNFILRQPVLQIPSLLHLLSKITVVIVSFLLSKCYVIDYKCLTQDTGK